jgi:hypothetical protein
MDRAMAEFSNDTIDELAAPVTGASLTEGATPSSGLVTVNVGGVNMKVGLGALLTASVVAPLVIRWFGRMLLTVVAWEVAKGTVKTTYRVTKAALMLPLKAPGITGKVIAAAAWYGGLFFLGKYVWEQVQKNPNYQAGQALLAQALPELSAPQAAPTGP